MKYKIVIVHKNSRIVLKPSYNNLEQTKNSVKDLITYFKLYPDEIEDRISIDIEREIANGKYTVKVDSYKIGGTK